MGVAGSVVPDRPRWQRALRVARLAAIGTGATVAAAAAGTGVLLGQARQARRTIPMAEAPPPRCDGIYGAKFPGPAITMVILGDSSAAGYGVHRRRETPGALLATGLSRRLQRPVRLHRFAVVGAISAGLKFQVEAALECDPEVAVILIGGNDVTNRTPPALAVRYLVEEFGRCARPVPRWSSGPARTWARSAPSNRRCAGWPAGGAGNSPPHRRSLWCRPAAGRSPRRPARSPVRRRAGADVRLGPVPSLRRRIRGGCRRTVADGALRAGARCRTQAFANAPRRRTVFAEGRAGGGSASGDGGQRYAGSWQRERSGRPLGAATPARALRCRSDATASPHRRLTRSGGILMTERIRGQYGSVAGLAVAP
ncbi:hypothetical protein GCM10029963_37410 [Micromonospora andamanensis]